MDNSWENKILHYFLIPLWYLLIWLPHILQELGETINRKIIIIQEKFDPIPKQKRSESGEEWLKRIDLKYAIRYATFMRLSYFPIDYKDLEERIRQAPSKRDKEFLRLLGKLITHQNAVGAEHYRIVIARKEFEERMQEAQG